jgi:hypothetical protein
MIFHNFESLNICEQPFFNSIFIVRFNTFKLLGYIFKTYLIILSLYCFSLFITNSFTIIDAMNFLYFNTIAQ